MSPRAVVITFFAAVAALVLGWIGGAVLHEVVGGGYETAVGVVDTEAGVPVASPSPTPTTAVTAPATESPTPVVTESPTPVPTESPTPTPVATSAFPTFEPP